MQIDWHESIQFLTTLGWKEKSKNHSPRQDMIIASPQTLLHINVGWVMSFEKKKGKISLG